MIFETMLIGAEDARSSKMLSHFLRAVLIQGCLFNVLQEYGAGETPQALKRRGGSPERPRKAKRLECESTGKFNKALFF
ncbi:hypothetical protein BN000_02267 [Neobacillus massiliamazoniensis]|uniref:Uncharacterized protein n=1 Tax=Neobacillus massiliamazoniensis TaxID=1499688 RepID=A0A0U1NWF4_9BACI|nr:hypothetical protein BN000_02267 [Neobacillus massiliamazoniensis]